MRKNGILSLFKSRLLELDLFNLRRTNNNKIRTMRQVQEKVQKKLFNPSFLKEFDKSGNTLSFEQYKLLVQSTDKTDETRISINNIFITLNSIFIGFLTQVDAFESFRSEKLIFLIFVLPIFIIICCDWVRIIESYKKLNIINYALLKTLEIYLPSNVFSLRSDLLKISAGDGEKANIITSKELLIPIAFLAAYVIYFCMILYQLRFCF